MLPGGWGDTGIDGQDADSIEPWRSAAYCTRPAHGRRRGRRPRPIRSRRVPAGVDHRYHRADVREHDDVRVVYQRDGNTAGAQQRLGTYRASAYSLVEYGRSYSEQRGYRHGPQVAAKRQPREIQLVLVSGRGARGTVSSRSGGGLDAIAASWFLPERPSEQRVLLFDDLGSRSPRDRGAGRGAVCGVSRAPV